MRASSSGLRAIHECVAFVFLDLITGHMFLLISTMFLLISSWVTSRHDMSFTRSSKPGLHPTYFSVGVILDTPRLLKQ
jgi:hypothetical protein